MPYCEWRDCRLCFCAPVGHTVAIEAGKDLRPTGSARFLAAQAPRGSSSAVDTSSTWVSGYTSPARGRTDFGALLARDQEDRWWRHAEGVAAGYSAAGAAQIGRARAFAGDADVAARRDAGRALCAWARPELVVHIGSAEKQRPVASTPSSGCDDARRDQAVGGAAGISDGRVATVLGESGGEERWAAGRHVTRTGDHRMAASVGAKPGLDPDALLDADRLPGDPWSALLFQVVGQAVPAGSIRPDAIRVRECARYTSCCPERGRRQRRTLGAGPRWSGVSPTLAPTD